MSLKQEIETWVEALNHYDANEFIESLERFDLIADTSKIFFNIGVIHATLGEHERAVEAYQRAVKLDIYFAVAYFQQGVSNFLLGDFEEALANFNDSLLYLRGNTLIDYDQLGLKFRLYSCEVLFNRGLCYMYLQQEDAGMQDFSYAVKEKQVEDHNVIDDAIRENAEGYTVFSIPVGVVYRPNESKVRNIKTKDYLGKARLVAASDSTNAFTGFAGTEVQRVSQVQVTAKDDRDAKDISYAAMNLVIPGKTSKGDSDSPKADDGQTFPPTPPPERDTTRLQRETPRQPSRNNSVASASPVVRSTAGSVRDRAGSRTDTRTADRRDRRQNDIAEEEEYSPPRRAQGSRSEGSFGNRQGFANASTRRNEAERPLRRAPTNASSRRQRNDSYSDDAQEEEYEDVYDYYGNEGSSRGGQSRKGSSANVRRQPSRRQPVYNDDYQSEGDSGSDGGEEEFEMVASSRRGGGQKKVPEIKKIKVKIHAEDTRMVMINTNVDFTEFGLRLKEKMGMSKPCKFKVKDEDGEMILVGDQEDLDMAVSQSKKAAKKERAEMGKLEIWIM